MKTGLGPPQCVTKVMPKEERRTGVSLPPLQNAMPIASDAKKWSGACTCADAQLIKNDSFIVETPPPRIVVVLGISTGWLFYSMWVLRFQIVVVPIISTHTCFLHVEPDIFSSFTPHCGGL